jgi:predicted metal-dependent HD superfamily phosphohydrolase
MAADDATLAARWRAAVPSADPAAADAALADLRARYGEPHRRYHTLAHVAAVLAALDGLPGAGSPAAVLAAWYHDAIYDPTAPGNEAASAELARAVLPGLGVDAATVAETARLVELTAKHAVAPGDDAGAAVVDADLSILGAPADVYDRYTDAVRAEYGHVPDERWRPGRAAVLATFAERPVLFHTAVGRERWEAAARANLARELAALQ